MAIARIAAAKPHFLQRAANRHRGPRVVAGLAGVDVRRFGLDLGVERETDRNAIEAVAMGDRDAKVEPVFPDVSEAAGHFLHLGIGVRQPALEVGQLLDRRVGACRRLLPKIVRQQISAGPKVVGLGEAGIAMENDMAAQRNIDRAAQRALVGRGPVGCGEVGMKRRFGHAPRNSRIDDVDHPADRRRSEHQRRRPAQDLDTLSGHRVDGHFMIGAGRRHVEAADTIGQQADSIARQAAQDRPRRGRAETGCADPRLAGQRLADGLAPLADQFGAADHRHAAEHVPGTSANAGDDDRLLPAMLVMTVLVDGRAGHRRLGGLGFGGIAGLNQEKQQGEHRRPRNGFAPSMIQNIISYNPTGRVPRPVGRT